MHKLLAYISCYKYGSHICFLCFKAIIQVTLANPAASRRSVFLTFSIYELNIYSGFMNIYPNCVYILKNIYNLDKINKLVYKRKLERYFNNGKEKK